MTDNEVADFSEDRNPRLYRLLDEAAAAWPNLRRMWANVPSRRRDAAAALVMTMAAAAELGISRTAEDAAALLCEEIAAEIDRQVRHGIFREDA